LTGAAVYSQPLRFVLAGMFDQRTPVESVDLNDAQAFAAYLIGKREFEPRAQAVPQRNGGTKYAVDQVENPQTIVIHCGGLTGERLVAGQVGTASDSDESKELFELFSKLIRARFERIKSYYVGPDAAKLLDSGTRLTPTAKSPETYDLARECRDA
jgi:hypothetical protein